MVMLISKDDENRIKFTSAQILPTTEMVSTGYNPRRVSAPKRTASLPETIEKDRR